MCPSNAADACGLKADKESAGLLIARERQYILSSIFCTLNQIERFFDWKSGHWIVGFRLELDLMRGPHRDECTTLKNYPEWT